MDTILELFFLPPMAIARLGSSDTPMESFTWAENPSVFGGNMTTIEPAVSFEVSEDGSLRPYIPQLIRFRDGKSLRPVAPFFELWATVQSDEDGAVKEVPLTLDLLTQVGASLENIRYRVMAGNRKASFRTGNPACSYVAMVDMAGNDCKPYPLLAYSGHTSGQEPLVFKERPIPLGYFQVMIPNCETKLGVDLSILRVRFTPAKGKVYAPPNAISGPASPLSPGEATVPPDMCRVHEIVPPENRILNDKTPWSEYIMERENDDPQPCDSYDGANVGNDRSWGVADDTCDATIEAHMTIAGQRFTALARVMVGPPDFAPDRRSFYSIADDFADRDLPTVTVDDATKELTAAEICDLFNRIFEAVSLMNLDALRTRAIGENDANAPHPETEGLPKLDHRSMTKDDAPYADKSPDLLVSATPKSERPAEIHNRLPYTEVAKFVHAPMTDIKTLLSFLRSHKEHIERLIRPPYGDFHQLEADPKPNSSPHPQWRDPRILRDTRHDMRMPPYMRDSDHTPLSLTKRQYTELIELLKQLNEPAPK